MGHEAAQLTVIAANSTRWQIAHLLGLLGFLLWAPALFGLAGLGRRRWPKWAGVATALGVVGLVGTGFLFALEGFAWGALGTAAQQPGVDPASLATALNELRTSAWNTPYLLAGAWLAGFAIALRLAVLTANLAPAAANVLAVGLALTAFEQTIHDNRFFIVTSTVLAIGGIATAVSLRAHSGRPRAGAHPQPVGP